MSNAINFKNHRIQRTKLGDKIKDIYIYPDWSNEKILSRVLKSDLDEQFNIKYPRRNDYVEMLFDHVKLLRTMEDFVVYRTDFKSYFESLPTSYIYEHFIQDRLNGREEHELLRKYCDEIPKCYTGLPLSNTFAELIGKEFDMEIQAILHNEGLIFYKRYIDDCIFIFNKFIDKKQCELLILSIMSKVFWKTTGSDECSVDFSTQKGKVQYISRRGLNNSKKESFNYLGYEFYICPFSKCAKIEYGITRNKRIKYTEKVNLVIKSYQKHKDMELLRHQLRAFTHRVVYRHEYESHAKWYTFGFIDNYGALRHVANAIENDTKDFLENLIWQQCKSCLGFIPYFVSDRQFKVINPRYNLYNTLAKNRALIFEPSNHIGISKNALRGMCKQIGLNTRGRTYADLVDNYIQRVINIR